MILFSYFCQKNCFPFGAWSIISPFLCKLGPKINFQEVLHTFFTTTLLQHKLLMLIESLNIFHWKSAKKGKCVWSVGQNLGEILYNDVKKTKKNCYFNGFFWYFAWGIHLQVRISVIEIPEWKSKAKLARTIIFEENHDDVFAHFGSKIAKKWLF